MQNNSNNKFSLKNFFKQNGYYMVLALCIAAVGVSGYLFIDTASNSPTTTTVEPTLSVPVTPDLEDKEPLQREDTADSALGEMETTQTIPAKLPEPVVTVYPTQGEVLAVFSIDQLTFNETTQDYRTHNGLDLACAQGDPVVSVQPGTVSAIYNDKSLGWTVKVKHDDTLETQYSNLSETMAVAVGDTVTAGQTLGTVGTTAITELAQADHLHFAVYQDGALVDPAAFLSANT